MMLDMDTMEIIHPRDLMDRPESRDLTVVMVLPWSLRMIQALDTMGGLHMDMMVVARLQGDHHRTGANA